MPRVVGNNPPIDRNENKPGCGQRSKSSLVAKPRLLLWTHIPTFWKPSYEAPVPETPCLPCLTTSLQEQSHIHGCPVFYEQTSPNAQF